MKKSRFFVLFIALSLILASCGGGTDTPAGQDGPTEPQTPQIQPPEEPETPETPATALDVMRQINVTKPLETGDKYRSFYEIFVYSYRDSDGDGVGDLQGIISSIDLINDGDSGTDTDLGATGLWLTPVNPSPTYHKYDVTDYREIDPEFGTLEDYRELLDQCHSRGIAVIMDLVMNHTSSQHPWFKAATEYLKSLPQGAQPDVSECPYVDYYSFTQEKAANRYEVGSTGWYYDAPFWSEMPDLNLGSEAVRSELADIAKYWLDMGVDGFRLDAAKEYFTGDVEANVEFLGWFNGVVKGIDPDAYIVAEVWNDISTYAQYLGSGIDSVFDFAFADKSGTIANVAKGSSPASAYGRALEDMQSAYDQYSQTWIDAPFYTNHDMGRAAGYYPGDQGIYQVKMGLALNLMMSGASFTYYGEELGMKGAGKDENKRAPMYWSDDPSAPGMCAGPPDMDSVKMIYPAFDRQSGDGDSILNFVIQAIRLRGAFPAVSHGRADMVEELSTDFVCVLKKTYEDKSVTLVFNLSPDVQTVDVSGLGSAVSGALLTSAQTPELEGGSLTCPGYSVTLLT